MTMRHDEPYVVERDRTMTTTETSSPVLLIIGILLAIGLAIGAWFAFNNDGGSGDVNNIDNPTIVEPGTGGDTTGDTTGGNTDTTTP